MRKVLFAAVCLLILCFFAGMTVSAGQAEKSSGRFFAKQTVVNVTKEVVVAKERSTDKTVRRLGFLQNFRKAPSACLPAATIPCEPAITQPCTPAGCYTCER